ncbi:MAG: hypothetical protein ACOYYS_27645 [Chloroflexota bacterium]
MKSIFIGCDSFLALRNVRNADLGTQLAQKRFAVKVFVDPHQFIGSKAANIPDIDVFPLFDFHIPEYKTLSHWLSRMELSRKSFKDPGTFFSKLTYRLADRRMGKLRVYPTFFGGWVSGALGFYKRYRQNALDALRQTSQYTEYINLLKLERPVLVVGFSPEGSREMALMQAAVDLGISTLIMIRSRDNLVSKIAFLPKVDEYFVWSAQQKKYFYHLYPELRDRPVSIVGSPQFSRHGDPSFRLPRKDFFERIRLDPDKPLVVFCLENPNVAPHQGNLALALAEAASAKKVNRDAQLLIRNHPRAFGSDYDPLNGQQFPGVALYPEPTTTPFGQHDDNIVRLILEDEPMHLATMAYQDVNVNIMSTATIDSAIFDKPIIHIAFDIPASTPANISVKRFFHRTDYKVIERTGASQRAHSLDELISLVNYALWYPTEKSQQRAELVALDVGMVSGAPNDWMLERFIELAN